MKHLSLITAFLLSILGVAACSGPLGGGDEGEADACPAGQTECSGICVQVAFDLEHCGACGSPCEAGKFCVNGVCGNECGAGTLQCGDRCADVTVDRNNCGSCGNVCGVSEVCSEGQCSASCLGGTSKCGNVCVDTTIDPSNCGGCGIACEEGQVCSQGKCSLNCSGGTTKCGGRCVDTEFDAAHCGKCNEACGTGEVCSEGVCGLECYGGSTKCATQCVDTFVDTAHCGGCNISCPSDQVCALGQCNLDCVGGTTQCGGTCVDTDFNAAHCGGCNKACAANEVCSAGSCQLSCVGGATKCGNECVDTDVDPGNCGTCGTLCPNGQVCSGGLCQIACGGGSTQCGSLCIDTALDPVHCGGCDQACAQGEVCYQGQCALQCGGGSTKCGTKCVDPQLDTAHCGQCNNACAPGEVCSGGTCKLNCDGGALKCGTKCVDPQLDPAHCGACNQACAAGEVCSAGQCMLQCGGGSTNCSGKCVDTSVDASHCGSCNNACAQGQLCSQGQCGISCNGGSTKCGDQCVDTKLDPAHCGGCDQACEFGGNSVAVCSNSSCSLVCQNNHADCNTVASDGCEVNLLDDVAHCSACNSACGAIANGSPACINGGCGVGSCEAGFDDCDKVATNGCESSLNFDTNNCGSCGSPCGSNKSCAGGNCYDYGQHIWSYGYGSSSTDYGHDMAIDSQDNLVYTGQYYYNQSHGGSSLGGSSNYNVFVSKYDKSHNHLWSKGFGDGNQQYGMSVAVDSQDNVIVCGYFQYNIDFGGGNLYSGGSNYDMYVAKLDKDGKHVWSKKFGSTSSNDYCYSLAVDTQDNILFTGFFRYTVDFGGGPVQSKNNSEDIFLVKLDKDGAFVWGNYAGSTSTSERGYGVATDSEDSVYITGQFYQTVDFGGGPLTVSYPQGSQRDMFFVKYDKDGKHVFSKNYGGPHHENGQDLTVDSQDNVLVTGRFRNDVSFGGDVLQGNTSYDDIFLAKYKKDGTHIWSKDYGSDSSCYDYGYGVTTDMNDNIILTGEFDCSFNFGGGTLSSSSSTQDIFLLKLDPNGGHIWSKRFGSSGTDSGRSVATDSQGFVYLTGYYYYNQSFGGSNVGGSSHYNIVQARYAP